MRKKHHKRPIDSLFSKTRQGVLAATFGQSERWWFLSELATHLNTSPSSLQRELSSLIESGILRQRRDGKRVYFQAEPNSPLFSTLRDLIIQTLGVVEQLKELLETYDEHIQSAFVYGSVARTEEHALSDVDLIVIGSVGLLELSHILRELERKLLREFNTKCYSPQEFQQKVHSQNHFVLSVLKKKKIFVKGEKDDLEKILGQSAGTNSQNKRVRNRRVA
ncbi:MAG: nucleotidyltransferase domain-containing protein [Pyrinomonadaceae bacterium]